MQLVRQVNALCSSFVREYLCLGRSDLFLVLVQARFQFSFMTFGEDAESVLSPSIRPKAANFSYKYLDSGTVLCVLVL